MGLVCSRTLLCLCTQHHLKQQQEGLHYRYHGGLNLLESFPITAKFVDVRGRLAKKAGAAVDIKYQLPCDELDPDNLISVGDDEDLQEMMDEYERSIGLPDTKAYRLRVFLFPSDREYAVKGSGAARFVWCVGVLGRRLSRVQCGDHHHHSKHSRSASRIMTHEGKSSFGSNASSKSQDNLDADVRDAFTAGFEAGLAHQLQMQHEFMDTEMAAVDTTPIPSHSMRMMHLDDEGLLTHDDDVRPSAVGDVHHLTDHHGAVVQEPVHLPEHISAFGDALLSEADVTALRSKLAPGTLQSGVGVCM